jgi:hypothetical protein
LRVEPYTFLKGEIIMPRITKKMIQEEEERGMMTMFSPAIDNIVDLIIKHYNDDFIYNNMNIFPTIYSFLHIYKKSQKIYKNI